jgi:hypothetical protein
MSLNASWGWYKAYKIWQREGAMNCAELFSFQSNNFRNKLLA